jgi:hypothetical protein
MFAVITWPVSPSNRASEMLLVRRDRHAERSSARVAGQRVGLIRGPITQIKIGASANGETNSPNGDVPHRLSVQRPHGSP